MSRVCCRGGASGRNGRSGTIDEQWLREQYVVKRRSFTDIAAECGISEMTAPCSRFERREVVAYRDLDASSGQ
jgi:hypothetical protein